MEVRLFASFTLKYDKAEYADSKQEDGSRLRSCDRRLDHLIGFRNHKVIKPESFPTACGVEADSRKRIIGINQAKEKGRTVIRSFL